MSVADQWRFRDKTSPKSSSSGVATTSTSGLRTPSAASPTESSTTLPVEQATPDHAVSKSSTSDVDVPNGRTAKNLAGFWSSQSHEVKVRKKRLIQVDDDFHTVSTDIERSPSSTSSNAAPASPKDSEADIYEVGRTKNISSVFQQKHQTEWKQPSKTSSAADQSSIISIDSSSRGHSSTSSTTAPETVLNRKSEAIVLAENQPIELDADVVRSEGSSWDDVAELESGRTKNLLAHWNKTEQEYAQPKTSTTRYRGGSKPAWILEIEAAKETSTGAIGSSWTAPENNGKVSPPVCASHFKPEEIPEVSRTTTSLTMKYVSEEPEAAAASEVSWSEQQSSQAQVGSGVNNPEHATPPASCEIHQAAPLSSIADEDGIGYPSKQAVEERPYFDFDPLSFTIDLMNGGAPSTVSTDFGGSSEATTQKQDDIAEVFMPVANDQPESRTPSLFAMKATSESSASTSTIAVALDALSSSICYQENEFPPRDVTKECATLSARINDAHGLRSSSSDWTPATPSDELSHATRQELMTMLKDDDDDDDRMQYLLNNPISTTCNNESNILDMERSGDVRPQATHSVNDDAEKSPISVTHAIREEIPTAEDSRIHHHSDQESSEKKRKEDKRKLGNEESTQTLRGRSWCLIL